MFLIYSKATRDILITGKVVFEAEHNYSVKSELSLKVHYCYAALPDIEIHFPMPAR